MSSNPLVSILIPAYNSEKWIRSTVQSALAQTWKNKEIIIVDDGSKDDTLNIAKRFESKYVKVVTQVNSGASAARNKALHLAQGDFIQWLDSDDILAPDKIELHLEKSGYDPQTKILHSSAWGFFYFSLKRAEFLSNSLWQDLSPKDWLINHLGKGYFMYPAVWLVSRRLTGLAGPWDERLTYNDDGEYFCRVVAASEKVNFCRDAISYHRSGNITSLSNRSGSKKAIESLNLSLNLCVEYLLAIENSETTRKACVNSLQKIINADYQSNPSIIKANQQRIIKLGGNASSPKRTGRFRMLQNIFGPKTAAALKFNLWNLEIITRKYWDKLLSIVYRDAV